MAYIDEDTGLEVLSLTECVRLLESNELGRLAVSTDDGHRIYPINYHWDGEAVVFRTTPRSTIAANEGRDCLFEIDGSDLRERLGWSVTALGVPNVVDATSNPETLSGWRSTVDRGSA